MPVRPPARHYTPVCVTLRCSLSCPWCEYCRGPSGPVFSPQDGGNPTPADVRDGAIRLHGGDPLLMDDLGPWIRWVQEHTSSPIVVEGTAAGLGEVARLDALAAHDIAEVRLLLPAMDPTVVERLVGSAGLVEATISAARGLIERGTPTVVVVPINPATVVHLGATIMGLAEALGDAVPLVLSAMHLREGRGEGPSRVGDEIDALGRALLGLPDELPGRARLWMDDWAGYPPCVIPRAAWRPELFPRARWTSSHDGAHGAGTEECRGCSWRRRCLGLDPSMAGLPVRSLGVEDEHLLGSLAGDDDTSVVPTLTGEAAEAIGATPCVAPWTTMFFSTSDAVTVPCAPAWLDSQGLVVRGSQDGRVVSLADIWNGPLFRHVREQMASAPYSDRCRPTCRVVLGDERRGLHFFTASDTDLEPSVAANRAAVLESIAARRPVMTATPLELVVSLASRCNISCLFCQGPQEDARDLDEARSGQIEAWLPGMQQLSFVGGGEPLTSKGFHRLVDHIARHGYPSLGLSLTTNGTLLSPQWLQRVGHLSWGQVRVSLNAGSPAVHEQMTGERLFDRILGNLDALAAYRAASNPTLEIVLSCVLSRLVLGDLHAFAAIVHRYGAFPVLEPMTGNLGGLSPYVDLEVTARLADECAAVARDYEHVDPDLHRAFATMEAYARDRLARGDTTVLPQY